jgi:hypothetical protein
MLSLTTLCAAFIAKNDAFIPSLPADVARIVAAESVRIDCGSRVRDVLSDEYYASEPDLDPLFDLEYAAQIHIKAVKCGIQYETPGDEYVKFCVSIELENAEIIKWLSFFLKNENMTNLTCNRSQS